MTILNTCALAILSATLIPLAQGKNLYVDYSVEPTPVELLRNEICIIHPEAKASFEEGHKRGNEYYAYLSLVEVVRDNIRLAELIAAGIQFPGENREWQSKVVDIRQREWKEYFVNEMAQQAADRNFDGFFIDTVDSIELLAPDKTSGEYASCQKAVLEILAMLKSRFPSKKIMINRGFDLVEKLTGIVDGVLVESIFTTTDLKGSKTVEVDWSITEQLLTRIDRLQLAGFATYAIDYVAPGDRETAIEAEKRLRSLGCIPYIGTRKLDGTNAYQSQIPRKILVIYGHDPEETEKDPVLPGDTLTLGKIQCPLEWMGYEFEYHNISNGMPEYWDDREFCGIVIDESLTVPRRYEVPLAKWLAKRLSERTKTLFLGTGGLKSSIAKELVFYPLGLTFAGSLPPAGGIVATTRIDPEYLNFEVKTEAISHAFQSLQAPEDSEVLLSLEMKTGADTTVKFDPVFLTDWGGFLLEPYASYQVSPEIDLSHVDMFKFLGRIWPEANFPVPDVTTRQGLRIFYSHIDGDGFISIGRFPGRPLCGEVLYDKILKDLQLPVTVSIVGAEIRGHMLSQVNPKVDFNESVARRIFELPNVEPASHSYSHPYVWDPEDKSNYKQYTSPNLSLKLTARYPKIDLKREINGSLDYIKEKLSGPGNPPKIFLWSGNCRPSTEALRLVREYGIENMNGGNTILSREFPGLANIAPKLIDQEGEVQVFASNQNEFYYTDGWKGPFFNGFRKVIETFEMTESPKRMKPVNVYYHFYSAERQDSLSSIQTIYDWCKKQELHMMTTAEYAAMVRDSHTTVISKMEPGRWKIQNQGHHRTFRIPAKTGFPDMQLSSGVTGWKTFQDALYISTDGSEEVILTLTETEPAEPYLVSSSENVTVSTKSNAYSLRNTCPFRDSNITLGGMQNGAWTFKFTGEMNGEVNGAEGKYSFTLPAGQTVTVTPAVN